jgi:RNA polymerase sigma factor (sigma-70 family)
VNEKSDQELLREYAREKSDAAFADLVHRHLDFVYSAALRLVVDRHLAEDVTQAVFAAASRHAGDLQGVVVFSAWLHRTTRNQAAMLVRGEARRRARENEAAAMTDAPIESGEVWEKLAPHLDDALGQLESEDRDALLLRFFEKKTAREIGERLGLSPEAAQKRMARALERLRAIFARQGLSISGATLGTVISAQGAQVAPGALGTAVLAACSSAAGVSLVSTSMFSVMASTKIKTAWVAMLTAGLGTTVLVQYQTNNHLREEMATLKAAPPPAEIKQPAVEPNEKLEALRRGHLELMRLRAEVTALRQQAREHAAAAAELSASKEIPTPAQPAALPADFVPSASWNYVGMDTPRRAFESFLTILKGGDPAQIAATVQWEMAWREPVTEEDKALMEKSKEDYLEMLHRAPGMIAAFNFAPAPEDSADRTRVFFRTMTTDGTPVDSSFEMAQVDGQWKPVLKLGWFGSSPSSPFSTSPVFGPKIDLER